MEIIVSEFSEASSEEYLSDDTECLDFQEIETEERLNQELLSEITNDHDEETDGELQAYMDGPLAVEGWLKNYKQQQEEKNKREVLKKRLADETGTGEW